MIGLRFVFTPFDTLFFSDGRRFDQDNEGLAEAASEYPPSPHVLANAVRGRLAAVLRPGWDGSVTGWTQEIEKVLGSGAWDMGELRLSRIRVEEADGQSFLPAPMTLLQREDGNERKARVSCSTDFRSDIAAAQWVAAGESDREFELAALGGFIAETDLQTALLGGGRLGRMTVLAVEKMAPLERRVGLTRSPSGAAEPGMLYVAEMRRPTTTLRSHAGEASSLSVQATLSSDSFPVERLARWVASFGGRGRFADCRVSEGNPVPDIEVKPGIQFCYLATPALVEEGCTLFAMGAFKGIDGVEILACAVDRPKRFAPWDPVRDGGRRGPWCWSLPAGAIWKLDVRDDNAAMALAEALNETGLNELKAVQAIGNEPSSGAAYAMGFGEPIMWPQQGGA